MSTICTMSSVKVYPGFAWAVPTAFGAAIHACRFEQGDVLYSEISAYDESRRSKHPARYHVQVLDPPRTTRALGGDAEGQRFFTNWESLVRFEWMDYREGDCSELRSTQGGLFTCLWKGDVEALRAGSDAISERLRPWLLRDLQPKLADAVESMVERLDVAKTRGSSKGGRTSGRQLFACAIDQSSDASRIKSQSIVRALEANFAIEFQHFSPGELELAEAERFHPALDVLGVVVECPNREKLEAVLRERLYAGGRAAAGDSGRFQLARHGLLVALD